MPKLTKPRVIDFFSGAGGFSEGFRQQGFDVVMGVENWRPAVRTHNLNHGLADEPMDVLWFEKGSEGIAAIEGIEDTEVIIGSPPCVSFSMSNKAGKADKTLGIRLIQAYLRFIAVKKHKKGSVLKAWLMENVPNSRNYVQKTYTFADLDLSEWAKGIDKNADDIALRVQDNGDVLTASDYGAPQRRDRFVCGEITATGKFPTPEKTNKGSMITLRDIIGKMPSPLESKSRKLWTDPNYPLLKLTVKDITDHLYDTGVYEVEWQAARFAKVNHPFMGRMSFPEDESRPSRTIMATRSASTREALLYKSEYGRKGDGEYRLPTIREASSLMGFPLTYQFSGSEGTKWRQIGNAVCPPMASALAIAIRKAIGLKQIAPDKVIFPLPDLAHDERFVNLNDLPANIFENPPRKKPDSKFRRHPFKEGNMTVALTNFSENGKRSGKKWYSLVFLGSGKTHTIQELPKGTYQEIGMEISRATGAEGIRFVNQFVKEFSGRIGNQDELQEMYITRKPIGKLLEPGKLVDEIAAFIDEFEHREGHVVDKVHAKMSRSIPIRQLYAMYALNYVVSAKVDKREQVSPRRSISTKTTPSQS